MKIRVLRSLLAAFVAVGVAACGPSGGGDDDDDGNTADGAPVEPGSLLIEPGNVILYVEDGAAATQDYVVTFIDDGGDRIDVTAESVLTVDNSSLGSFSGATLTTGTAAAGRTKVRATARGASATADLLVHLTHIVVTTGTPGNAPEVFDGASGGGVAPEVVYPDSGIIVPPNLNVIEFHYLAGGQNDLFELEFVGSLISLEVYTSCNVLGAGCYYEPDEAAWELLAQASRGEDPLVLTVRGLDSSAGTPAIGAAAGRSLSFSNDDMTGGIYYWNAEAGQIKRYDFGRRGQSAEDYLNQAQTGATTCVGCHAISRDGKRIAVGLDIPGPAVAKGFDVATRAELWTSGSLFGEGGANFFAFSPDSSQVIASNGINMVLRDANSGAAITDPLIDNGTMPDWSPDGSLLVYARPATAPPCFPGACGAPGITGGSLVLATPGTWSDGTVLVASAGNNNYYPSFSPDSEWILFNRSPTNTDSFDSPDAQAWVVSKTGGDPIRLANASPGPAADSWPKWAPFVHSYRDGTVFWLTFSSRRDYGLRLQGQSRSQIWMVGFDPAAAAAGNDPSFRAFWLPFQDMGSGNHIAQWVEEVDREDCDNDDQCEATEFCEEGTCVPIIE